MHQPQSHQSAASMQGFSTLQQNWHLARAAVLPDCDDLDLDHYLDSFGEGVGHLDELLVPDDIVTG